MATDARAKALLQPGKRFYPFTRDDSQRMVFGPATSEAEDSYGTIFALAATREALAEYEQWRTLRAMHANLAAGTVPILELDDQALHIGARVVDDAEWKKVDENVYRGFSIGFDPLDGHFEVRGGHEVFVFTKYRLLEISLVDRPSNPDCTFTLYRSAMCDYLMADKAAPWTFDWQADADGIIAAGGCAMLSDACAYFDASAPDPDGDGYPDDKAAYALPVAKLAAAGDAQLTLYFYGLVAAMAALNGGRKGVAVPDDQRQAVYDRLAALYAQFNETPPALGRRAQEDTTMDEKQLEQSVEKGLKALFARVLGLSTAPQKPETPTPAPVIPEPPPARVAVAPEARLALETAQKAVLAVAGNEALKAVAEPAVRALQGLMDAIEAPAEGTPPSAGNEALQAQIAEQGRTIKALTDKLEEMATERQSKDHVDGPTPNKSRYAGAFVGH